MITIGDTTPFGIISSEFSILGIEHFVFSPQRLLVLNLVVRQSFFKYIISNIPIFRIPLLYQSMVKF